MISASKFIKREAKGWRKTLRNAVKECAGTGKTFVKECDQSARNAAGELTGAKPKKRP